MIEMQLIDGRRCHTMPWVAGSPRPWRDGYERVFVHFTDDEKKHARNGKGGHVQIVRSSKLRSLPRLRLRKRVKKH